MTPIYFLFDVLRFRNLEGVVLSWTTCGSVTLRGLLLVCLLRRNECEVLLCSWLIIEGDGHFYLSVLCENNAYERLKFVC